MLHQRRVVDKMIEAYVSWREACLLVTDTYDSWARETGASAQAAFARYTGALDNEEQAADRYAGLIRQADRLMRKQPPAERLDASAWGVEWS
jgi:hypothetical protein